MDRPTAGDFRLCHFSSFGPDPLDDSSLRDQGTIHQAPYQYYVLPLGIWQWWAIFAPDPVRDNQMLEAEVIDAKGIRHIHEFPRSAICRGGKRWLGTAIPSSPQHDDRRIPHAARRSRHAMRFGNLDLTENAFPLWVSLYYEVTDAPPPGTRG